MPLIAAWVLLVLGSAISLLNFYLSFLRPLRYRNRRHEYRFVSGIPLLGSILCVGAFFLFPAGSALRMAAIAAALIDTGGIHWLPIAMLWRVLSGGDRRRHQ